MYKHKTNIDALKENKTSAYQYWKCRDQRLQKQVATGPRITKLIICKFRYTYGSCLKLKTIRFFDVSIS